MRPLQLVLIRPDDRRSATSLAYSSGSHTKSRSLSRCQKRTVKWGMKCNYRYFAVRQSLMWMYMYLLELFIGLTCFCGSTWVRWLRCISGRFFGFHFFYKLIKFCFIWRLEYFPSHRKAKAHKRYISQLVGKIVHIYDYKR